jgi:hypothetical protein
MSPDPIRGKTIRWTYEDGPLAGKTFEHTFATDGTVSYREAGGERKGTNASTNGKPKTEQPSEREPSVRYEHARINDDVHAVSYLSSSGFTLTSVLDLKAGTVVSFASNEKELVVQRGTFEDAKRAA